MRTDLDFMHKLSLAQRNLQMAQTAIDSAEEFLAQLVNDMQGIMDAAPRQSANGHVAPTQPSEPLALPPAKGRPKKVVKPAGPPPKASVATSQQGRPMWSVMAREYMAEHKGQDFKVSDIVRWAKERKGLKVPSHAISASLTYMKRIGKLAIRDDLGPFSPANPAIWTAPK